MKQPSCVKCIKACKSIGLGRTELVGSHSSSAVITNFLFFFYHHSQSEISMLLSIIMTQHLSGKSWRQDETKTNLQAMSKLNDYNITNCTLLTTGSFLSTQASRDWASVLLVVVSTLKPLALAHWYNIWKCSCLGRGWWRSYNRNLWDWLIFDQCFSVSFAS